MARSSVPASASEAPRIRKTVGKVHHVNRIRPVRNLRQEAVNISTHLPGATGRLRMTAFRPVKARGDKSSACDDNAPFLGDLARRGDKNGPLRVTRGLQGKNECISVYTPPGERFVDATRADEYLSSPVELCEDLSNFGQSLFQSQGCMRVVEPRFGGPTPVFRRG
jgi:hypothetical protein